MINAIFTKDNNLSKTEVGGPLVNNRFMLKM